MNIVNREDHSFFHNIREHIEHYQEALSYARVRLIIALEKIFTCCVVI